MRGMAEAMLRCGTTTDTPSETERIPRQDETDLQFIQRLAQRNGFVFYIEPVTMGVNKAYWGPQNRAGPSQAALTHDMGSATNVKSLRLMNDALAPIGVRIREFPLNPARIRRLVAEASAASGSGRHTIA